MIDMFESMVRRCPKSICFTYVDKTGESVSYTYRELRLLSAALASHLQSRGVQPGSYVSVDLPNTPAFIHVILAAAYGNFTLIVLNNRLTTGEKLSRIMEIERTSNAPISIRIDETNIDNLMRQAARLLAIDTLPAGLEQSSSRGPVSASAGRSGFTTSKNVADLEPRTAQALGRASTARAAAIRRSEQAQQDALENIIHFAEHSAHVFNREAAAVVMFTSGTTGRSKAVPLTWDNLFRAAEVSNATLNRFGEGLWQLALPLFHVGGLQILVRSLLNSNPFVLYEKFNPELLLDDGARRGATHVSVVDKMLQDMIATGKTEELQRYTCILLGGGAPNKYTLKQALDLHLRVFVSYGMTETASQMAHAQLTPSFNGGLRLLPGYRVHIVDPDPDGYGRLAIQGPGLFRGYLNMNIAQTVDGYFLTGDTAAIKNNLLYVRERTDDMFVSGGENIYPAEICGALTHLPCISDAYVFGVSDETWGRRPVAFVERDMAASELAGQGNDLRTNRMFAAAVKDELKTRLSKLYMPKYIHVLDTFPRNAMGKIDRNMLHRLHDDRIEIKHVTLYRIRLPFVVPFTVPQGVLTERESLIVEVTDHAGRTGLGECVSFSTNWYHPETLDQDVRVIRDVLAPLVLNDVFLHPSEVAPLLAAHSDGDDYPMACGAVEPALWDLYGKIVNHPLWQLIGTAYAAQGSVSSSVEMGDSSIADTLASSVSHGSGNNTAISVPAGAVIGVGPVGETVEQARRCAEAGYTRIKLKVVPGNALACAQAVRAAVPNMMITLDANQSFTDRDLNELYSLDECGVSWIEEPLSLKSAGSGVQTDLFARLARLQRNMRTPICLDESILNPQDAKRALSYPELRCFAVKVGKWGGVQNAIEFIREAHERGINVWMGGMYDTGISKRMHAAFETLPGVNAPGDISSTSRYFTTDVTTPPHTVERGYVTLNRDGYSAGLGCVLDRSALSKVVIDRIDIE